MAVIYLLASESTCYCLDSGWDKFEKDCFGNAVLEKKIISCIALKGQKAFHSGYEPRDKDKLDIAVLESISE